MTVLLKKMYRSTVPPCCILLANIAVDGVVDRSRSLRERDKAFVMCFLARPVTETRDGGEVSGDTRKAGVFCPPFRHWRYLAGARLSRATFDSMLCVEVIRSHAIVVLQSESVTGKEVLERLSFAGQAPRGTSRRADGEYQR
jgi:hypothetical protein